MARRLLIFLSFFFLLCTSREPPWADAHVVYDTTQALLSRGELNVHLGGPPWFYAHRNGRKYGVFPLGNVIAMAPSYMTFAAMRQTGLFPEQPLYALTCHVSPAIMMAGACALFYALCRRRGASRRLGLLLALGLGLCTTCLCYARSPYAEALQTLALLLLIERTLTQGRARTPWGMAGLGAAAGVLINAKLIYAPVLLFCALYLAYGELRRAAPSWRIFFRDALCALLAFLPFCGVMLWHNWLKTGSPFVSGYQIPGGIFSGDLATGLFGLLFSPGKGLVFYAPPLLLGALGLPEALRRRRAESVLLLSVIAVVTLLNARFRHWHGDYCWGPRYLVPVMPLLLLLCLPWLPEALRRGRAGLRRAAFGALLGSGLLVQVLGCAFYWDFYIRILIAVKDGSGAQGWFQEELGHGHFIPSFSPLRGHLWMLSHLLRGDPDLDRDAPWKRVAPQRVDLLPHYRAMRIDWWFLDWRRPQPGGQPLPAGLALLGLLGGGTLLAAAALGREALRPGRAPGPADDGEGGAAEGGAR